MNQDRISAAVQRAIAAQGISLNAFAGKIGISAQHLYTALGRTARESSPNLSTLDKIVSGAGLVLVAVPPEMAAWIEGKQKNNEL